MDLSPLIRAGFSRRQSAVLSAFTGGEAPPNVLDVRRGPEIAGQPIPYDEDATPNADGDWVCSSGLYIEYPTVRRLAGTAFDYDLETGQITYLESGLYLNFFYFST